MKLITVVCCYNDWQQYQEFRETLKKQNITCDLIGIDNRKRQYKSCSSALNTVSGAVKTKYIVYSHQDIRLPKEDMLARFLGYLEQTGSYDILGVAGAVSGKKRGKGGDVCVLSQVRHREELVTAGELEYHGMTGCETVDECFFGGWTECFRERPFDEKLCDDWHLYAVERCLAARAGGGHVYVCDIPMIHLSGGKINSAYNKGFRRLARHYRDAGWIRTVCGASRTDWLHRNLFYMKRKLLICLRRI